MSTSIAQSLYDYMSKERLYTYMTEESLNAYMTGEKDLHEILSPIFDRMIKITKSIRTENKWNLENAGNDIFLTVYLPMQGDYETCTLRIPAEIVDQDQEAINSWLEEHQADLVYKKGK